MLRVLELAIVSIVLALGAVLGYLYLETCTKTSQEVKLLKQVLEDLETTFAHLKSARYHVCLRISKVETANTTLVLDGKVLVIEHVVRIYVGDVNCDCTWYRFWLCLNMYKMCGIIDLAKLSGRSRHYVLYTGLLCDYVNVWIERVGNVSVVHIS